MTEGPFPEPARIRPKERGGARWGHASPFMRGSTIVRSQTFSPGARSQYVCRVSVIISVGGGAGGVPQITDFYFFLSVIPQRQ